MKKNTEPEKVLTVVAAVVKVEGKPVPDGYNIGSGASLGPLK